MQALLGISTLLSMTVSTVLGVRLLRLALRTGKAPEWTMSTAFLLAGVVGYAAIIVANPGAGALEGPWRERVFLCGYGLISLGVVLNYAFVCAVFRPRAAWARALVALAALLVLATIGPMSSAGGSGADADTLAYAVGNAARMGGGLWGTLEGFRYWRLMRRREALGLAEPVVTNRVLLWGTAALLTLVIFATSAAFLRPGQTAMTPGFISTISLLTCAAAAAQWLAFFPPRRYLAWVGARGDTA